RECERRFEDAGFAPDSNRHRGIRWLDAAVDGRSFRTAGNRQDLDGRRREGERPGLPELHSADARRGYRQGQSGDRALAARPQRGAPKAEAGNVPQSTLLPDVRTAVQRSVSLLERSTSQFFGRAACFACHEQPAAAFAVGAVRAKGIAIDEKAASERWTQLTSGLNATQLEGAAPLGGADNNLYLA